MRSHGPVSYTHLSVAVIEWAERGGDAVPDWTLRVTIEFDVSSLDLSSQGSIDKRKITFESATARWGEILEMCIRDRDLRFRLEVLRDLYTDIVEGSQSYKVYMGWIDKLGLYKKELESRPTIREIYIFKDPSVSVELGELQDIRKDVRYASMKAPDPSIPVSLRAFPEELSLIHISPHCPTR